MASYLSSCAAPQSEQTRISTAKDNVIVLDPFQMEALDRERTVRVYLPEDYDESVEAYPVIYAHDGQNLFDDSTSYAGEWGLDESLNNLAMETGFKAIVVGVDNGLEKRINELSPWENPEYGPAEGDGYMDFIVNQLKPHVDSVYRTHPEREHTAILGSSMGGLISHYAIYKFPHVFSKVIIFSPSYWYSNEIWDYTLNNSVPHDSRLWLEIGEKEGNAVDNTNKMYRVIIDSGHPETNIVKQIDPEGEHNEPSWRRQFVPAIKWLFQIQ